MLISDANRLLFIHVPKTGGVSIEGMLLDSCPDARKKFPDAQPSLGRHSTLTPVLKAEPQTQDYWIFGFVRNPWARLVSWYAMIEKWDRAYGPASGKPQDVKVGTMRDGNRMWRIVADYEGGFEEFVMRGTEELPRVRISQISYLRDAESGREADFIGRTEQLADDMAVVQERLGIVPTPPPHRNKSGHGSYRDYFNDATRARVAEVYAEDIDLFGYTY